MFFEEHIMSVYGFLQTRIYPGPQCSVEIYNPSNPRQHVEIHAIVDSGAVLTCIPKRTILEVGNLVRDRDVCVSGANNNDLRETYYVGIRLPDFQADIPLLRIISIPNKPYVYIGRDIINKYKIALDARNSVWKLNCRARCN